MFLWSPIHYNETRPTYLTMAASRMLHPNRMPSAAPQLRIRCLSCQTDETTLTGNLQFLVHLSLQQDFIELVLKGRLWQRYSILRPQNYHSYAYLCSHGYFSSALLESSSSRLLRYRQRMLSCNRFNLSHQRLKKALGFGGMKKDSSSLIPLTPAIRTYRRAGIVHDCLAQIREPPK